MTTRNTNPLSGEYQYPGHTQTSFPDPHDHSMKRKNDGSRKLAQSGAAQMDFPKTAMSAIER